MRAVHNHKVAEKCVRVSSSVQTPCNCIKIIMPSPCLRVVSCKKNREQQLVLGDLKVTGNNKIIMPSPYLREVSCKKNREQ